MLRTILFLIVILLTESTLPAKPKGDKLVGATVVGLQGEVTAQNDPGKGFQKVKLGSALSQGSTIKTGAASWAGLILADGSTLRLRELTTLTLESLRDSKGEGNTLLGLARGFVRAVVKKASGGSRFEFKTPNAVAAVKGTDLETGYDLERGLTLLKVFDTHGLGVILMDLKGEVEQLVTEGQASGFTEKGLEKVRALSQEELKGAVKELQDFLEQQREQIQGAGADDQEALGRAAEILSADLVAAQQALESAFAAFGEGTMSEEELGAFLLDVLEDLGAVLGLDGEQEAQMRLADQATGGTFIDRHGYQVQTSHLISRPAPAVIMQSHASLREEGPDAGTSAWQQTQVYNQPLPEDWMLVAKLNLWDPENLMRDQGSGNDYPIYYRLMSDLVVSNPHGDELEIMTQYDHPSYLNDFSSPYNLQQGYRQEYYVNGALKGQELFSASADFTSGIPVMPSYYLNNLGQDIFATGQQFTGAKGDAIEGMGTEVEPGHYLIEYYNLGNINNTKNELMFSVHVRLLDYEGAPLVGAALPFTPFNLMDVRRHVGELQGLLNLSFQASEFEGREIDLIFEDETFGETWDPEPPRNSGDSYMN